MSKIKIIQEHAYFINIYCSRFESFDFVYDRNNKSDDTGNAKGLLLLTVVRILFDINYLCINHLPQLISGS